MGPSRSGWGEMPIYLPVAEISIELFIPVSLGAVVGMLSGMFGVGGGFLLTPALIFNGVPPAVAVASDSAMLVGTTVSGVITHWRRGNVNLRLAIVLLVGGLTGSYLGVQIFKMMMAIGQIDIMVAILYVVMLCFVGTVMVVESAKKLLTARRQSPAPGAASAAGAGAPLALRAMFTWPAVLGHVAAPLGIGFAVGILSALMGIGGGFIMVPAMIYILGIPTRIVIGTSLLQIVFVTACTAFLQAVENRTVDALLAGLLLVGGVVGVNIGTWLGARLKAEQLRILLALLILAVGGRMAADLLLTPSAVFSVSTNLAGS